MHSPTIRNILYENQKSEQIGADNSGQLRCPSCLTSGVLPKK